MKNFVLINLMLFVFSVNMVSSQNDLWLVASSGMEFKNDDYQISSSIGEFVIETFRSGDYILTQGFHQTFDLGTVVAEVVPDLELLVYPNPFSDVLFLQINNETLTNTGPMEIRVADILGRLIHFENLEANTNYHYTLFTQNWSAGWHFLTIRFNDMNIEKTFKLIKN